MSTPNIHDRLALLAPTSSPDPERLAAARDAVFDVAGAPARADGPPRRHTRPSESRGDAHVVDLHDDALDDVVTPLDAARRRRNRHLGAAAAAAGVVGVISVGLVLVPGEVGIFSASSEATCEDVLLGNLDLPPGTAEELTWRTVASESSGTTDTTLLVLDGGGFAGSCSEHRGEGGRSSSTTTWSLPDVEPASGEILPRGITTGPASVVWGVAGDGVTGIRITREWEDKVRDELRSTSGSVAEARMTDDGYWSVFFYPEDRVPADAETTFAWTLTDGSERSMSLDEAWPGVDATTPLAEARREACVTNFQLSVRPVLEEVRNDTGVTFLTDDAGHSVLCLQDAAPPYSTRFATGGTTRDAVAPPTEDEAVATYGGGSGRGAALVGRAGDDVTRVEVRTADGLPFDAEVVDGYWVVWDPELAIDDDSDPWLEATLRWYLTDGSLGGESTVFE